MSKSGISLIAAFSENRVIGRENRLPWNIKSDLRKFREVTLGKPVIMGRKTFESLKCPLPNRKNIVVTRDSSFNAKGVDVFTDLDEALAFARGIPADEIMVIGGEQIFDATLHCANRMYLTLIKAHIDGDAYFPEFDRNQWKEVDRQVLEQLPDEPPAEFTVIERKAAAA
jgi:dihydrofolate reductase